MGGSKEGWGKEGEYKRRVLLFESLHDSRPMLGAGSSSGVELFQVFMGTRLWQRRVGGRAGGREGGRDGGRGRGEGRKRGREEEGGTKGMVGEGTREGESKGREVGSNDARQADSVSGGREG